MRFTYISSRKVVSVTTQDSLKTYIKLEFSLDLARVLGFKAGKKYSLENVPILGERMIDLTSNLNSLYVYCDLLQPVLVGDTKAPLLRIVDKSKKTGDVTYRAMNPIQYVPIQKKCFDTIEIKLVTDTGVVVPFFPGKCVVVLEFRRTAHSYFLI